MGRKLSLGPAWAFDKIPAMGHIVLVSRFKTAKALVLRTKQSGESNREAYFLTAEEGILKATVYGGPKSKLRSFVSIFHTGALYLYYDPQRSSYKVNDFDVEKWRLGMRESYERAITGSAVSETVLAGHGGGAAGREAFELANESLDAMENAGAAESNMIFLRFLWKWTEVLGIRPEMNKFKALHGGAGACLDKFDSLRPSMLKDFEADSASIQTAKAICTDILACALGRRLAGWKIL